MKTNGLHHPNRAADFLRRRSYSRPALSAGQKQRLSLARSLLRKPEVLILDEVSSNLDNLLEAEIADVIRKLKGTCTVVIVSHKPGILELADRIYELDRNGRLKPVEREAVFG